MIEFNDINFQWETEGDKRRLVIVVDNIAMSYVPSVKADLEQSIKGILNGSEQG